MTACFSSARNLSASIRATGFRTSPASRFRPSISRCTRGCWRAFGPSTETSRAIWLLVSIYQALVLVSFIALSGLLFRSFRFSPLESAALCAFLALSPWIIYWATVPFSDYLFAALVAGTFLSSIVQRESPLVPRRGHHSRRGVPDEIGGPADRARRCSSAVSGGATGDPRASSSPPCCPPSWAGRCGRMRTVRHPISRFSGTTPITSARS